MQLDEKWLTSCYNQRNHPKTVSQQTTVRNICDARLTGNWVGKKACIREDAGKMPGPTVLTGSGQQSGFDAEPWSFGNQSNDIGE
uniref:Transposase n=1 Tax=Candidatus Nitrotoga fabula TaxID=2182327 RepID=A0A2X0SIC7_9PROT|nr:protein of unknown function [Candidatus Nitrotoga fabula]